MIDLEKAKERFIKYADTYDMTNPHMERKKYHSIRVMEVSEKIAQNLGLNEEQIKLATLIGLLHDIARFEQRKIYNTFYDTKSIDHGDFGVQILEENNFIREFIEDESYDRIIKIAIKNHNKFKIEDGLSEEEILFSKIIRDADKVDIFYEGVEQFWKTDNELEEINNSEISVKVYEEFKKNKSINRNLKETKLDDVVVLFAFAYDFNFDYSREYILKENYIDEIMKRFNFTKEETKKKMDELIKILKAYL